MRHDTQHITDSRYDSAEVKRIKLEAIEELEEKEYNDEAEITMSSIDIDMDDLLDEISSYEGTKPMVDDLMVLLQYSKDPLTDYTYSANGEYDLELDVQTLQDLQNKASRLEATARGTRLGAQAKTIQSVLANNSPALLASLAAGGEDVIF